jgi:DNA-directed RNA polymerase specialized sigma24 family protein
MEAAPVICQKPEAESSASFFERLYEAAFPKVASYISRKGGTFEDAKDTFHDALVIYYEQRKRITLQHSEEYYILGIAKHLWRRKFEKDSKQVSITSDAVAVSVPPDPTVNQLKLLALLERTGKRCLEILVSAYHHHKRKTDLAASLGLGNAHSASVQKYKCLEKVRDIIKTKSITYEDFIE